MRVVIASRIFLPEPAAASLRLGSLATALLDSGAEVTVLTSRPPRGAVIADPPGLDLRRARVLRDRDGYVRGYLQYMSFDIPLAFRLLFARRPDVVVVEPPPTTGAVVRVICALRRIPYVYYAADVWADAAVNATSSSLVLRALRVLERFAWRGARIVLSVSESMTERLSQLGITERVNTVGNGVDSAHFGGEGPMIDLGSPYLVYTGTASEVHGAAIFARAFASVHVDRPDAVLVYVGQGSEWPMLAEHAAKLPEGAIRLVPHVPAEEVAGWLRGAHAALASVNPESGYAFAFPTKLYAAALCGTPSVFAGDGPASEFLIDGVAGRAVAYDEAAVGSAMRAALDDDVDAERRDRIRRWAGGRASGAAVAQRAADIIKRAAAR